MVASSWTTEEQNTFLQSHLPDYMALASSSRQYTGFWAKVREQWYTRWPTIALLFPDKEEDELTAEERTEVADAVQTTDSRLKTWFRWRANNSKNSSGRRGRKKGTDELIQEVFQDETGGRRLKESEMYSKLHYQEDIKGRVDEEIAKEAEEGVEITRAKRISIITRVTREVYNEKDEAVKAAVRQQLDEHNKKLEEGTKEPSKRTPQDYTRAIEDCATVLEKILTPLSQKTGWKFLVLMGGPDPQAGGKIAVASFNEGTTRDGKSFAQTYSEFENHYLVPYTAFLENLYPEDVRRQRSLYQNEDPAFHEPSKPSSSTAMCAAGQPVINGASQMSKGKKANNGEDEGRCKVMHEKENANTEGGAKSAVSNGNGSGVALNNVLQDIHPSQAVSPETTTGHVTPTEMVSPSQSVPIPNAVQGASVNPTMGIAPSQEWTNWDASYTSGAGLGASGYPQQQWANIDTSYLGHQGGVTSGYSQWANMNGSNNKHTGSSENPANPNANIVDHLASPSHITSGNDFGLSSVFPGIEQYESVPIPDIHMDIDWEEFASLTSLCLNGMDMSAGAGPVAINRPGLAQACPTTSDPGLSTTFPTSTSGQDLFGTHPRLRKAAALFPGERSAFPPPSSMEKVHSPDAPLAQTNAAAVPDASSAPQPDQDTSPAELREEVKNRPVQYAPIHVTRANNELLSQLCAILPSPGNPSTVSPSSDPSPAASPETRLPSEENSSSAAPAPNSAPTPPPVQPSGNSSAAEDRCVGSSEGLGGEGIRRSARGSVPTKRIEQMNKIGSNRTPPAPCADDSLLDNAPTVPPAWAAVAKQHLLVRDLGDEWVTCVERWYDLESELGFGAVGTKSALPAANLRPEEWSKWTVKSRAGGRQYHNTPAIVDPADFGLAVVKWWNAMQPEYRRSVEGVPKPMDTVAPVGVNDLWEPLLKSGPNGLVSVLTLLVWWGQALATRSRWQEDSTGLFAAMVGDVSACLRFLRGKKRKALGTAKGRPSKRARA